jgi:C-terminal processing protease CtpA/Prc
MLRRAIRVAAAALVLAAVPAPRAAAQSIEVDRQRGLQMLDQIHKDLVEHFFDPTFHGVDLTGLVARARQRIGAASSLGEILGILGGVYLDMRDSHTMFDPPRRVHHVRYGWGWQATGDRMLVAWIAPDSDAKAKGLRVGDTVVEIAGYAVTRADHSTLSYLLWYLRPQPKLTLVVERDGARRTLEIQSRIETLDNRLDSVGEYTIQEWVIRGDDPEPFDEWLADGVLYWRLPTLNLEWVRVARHERAVRKAKKVILDLRGNGGGSEPALLEAAGYFARGAEVLTRVTRRAREVVRTRKGGKPAEAEVIVLVDSHTTSAAEILARFLQLRDVRVIGDRTSGQVTNGRVFGHAVGDGDIKVLYRVQVAVADGIMLDGKRLEGVGVMPDTISLPTPDDLERGHDPVLVQAAAAFGVTLDPEKAARVARR